MPLAAAVRVEAGSAVWVDAIIFCHQLSSYPDVAKGRAVACRPSPSCLRSEPAFGRRSYCVRDVEEGRRELLTQQSEALRVGGAAELESPYTRLGLTPTVRMGNCGIGALCPSKGDGDRGGSCFDLGAILEFGRSSVWCSAVAVQRGAADRGTWK